MRAIAIAAALTFLLPACAHAEHPPLPLNPCRPAVAPADGPGGLHEYVGSMHEHSAYSDGYIGTTPSDYYRSGRCFGLDFLVGSDHSDFFATPIATSDECVDNVDLISCAQADPYQPANDLDKYGATQVEADQEQTPQFTTGRGFEWSSDRFGHINGYFAQHWTDWLRNGVASMKAFYAWMTRPTELGGGSDGLFTFNHPGDKSLCGEVDVCDPPDDPGFNWNDFRYVPRVDPQMVGIETFNGDSDYASPHAHGSGADGYYAHALDKGWHVGAIGAEDKGHKRTDRWGADNLAKTVMIAPDQSRDSLKQALRDRRFYATLGRGLRLDFTVDGAPMGSRLDRVATDRLAIHGALRGWDGQALAGDIRLDLITNGGTVAATAGDTLDSHPAFAPRPDAAPASRWYFLRATLDGAVVAYSSPVWIDAASGPGQWLAGDLHVHTCYSHDVVCGADTASEPDQAYTSGQPVGMRFAEAALRGLDYLAITDHNDVRSVSDPGFGAKGVIGIPGYEDSIRGHAQVLGERRLLDNGDASAAAINRLRDQVHADGGVFQANHPMDNYTRSPVACDHLDGMHWQYRFDVRPDTIEVWNLTSRVADAEAYLECWLDRGAHIGVTGGSDSHWTATLAVQGVGNPTTWVLARRGTPKAILAALRAGRTTVSQLPPAEGGAPLLIEVRSGATWVPALGASVAPGAAMRVRSLGPAVTGRVTVRANDRDLVSDKLLPPNGNIAFRAPAHGWVRASLHAVGAAAKQLPDCHHELGNNNPLPVSLCPYDATMLGLTSPVYVASR